MGSWPLNQMGMSRMSTQDGPERGWVTPEERESRRTGPRGDETQPGKGPIAAPLSGNERSLQRIQHSTHKRYLMGETWRVWFHSCTVKCKTKLHGGGLLKWRLPVINPFTAAHYCRGLLHMKGESCYKKPLDILCPFIFALIAVWSQKWLAGVMWGGAWLWLWIWPVNQKVLATVAGQAVSRALPHVLVFLTAESYLSSSSSSSF